MTCDGVCPGAGRQSLLHKKSLKTQKKNEGVGKCQLESKERERSGRGELGKERMLREVRVRQACYHGNTFLPGTREYIIDRIVVLSPSQSPRCPLHCHHYSPFHSTCSEFALVSHSGTQPESRESQGPLYGPQAVPCHHKALLFQLPVIYCLQTPAAMLTQGK